MYAWEPRNRVITGSNQNWSPRAGGGQCASTHPFLFGQAVAGKFGRIFLASRSSDNNAGYFYSYLRVMTFGCLSCLFVGAILS